MTQLMPLPLTVSCFSKIRTGFTFLVPAHLGSPGKKGPLKGCVCVYTGQPALAGSASYKLEDFVGAKFYCIQDLADGNQQIWIKEKKLEISSTVLFTLSPYLKKYPQIDSS